MIDIVSRKRDGGRAVDIDRTSWRWLARHRPKATFSPFGGAAGENLLPTFCRLC